VAGDVGAQPRGGLLGHPAQRFCDQFAVASVRLGGRTGQVPLRESVGVEADGSGLVGPGVVQRRPVHTVDLGRTRGHRRDSFQSGNRARVGVSAVMLVAPPANELVQLGFHLGAALGQDTTDRLGDTPHDRRVFVGLVPGDPEPVGQFASQGGVVDPADRALLTFQEAGIEGQPPTCRVLHLGGDHGMGVQLRVHGPRRVLTEEGRYDPPTVDLIDTVTAPTGHRPMGLEPPQRGVHGRIMGGQDLGPHEQVR